MDLTKLTFDYMAKRGKTRFTYETHYDPEGVALIRDINGPITTIHGVYKLEADTRFRVLEMFTPFLSNDSTVQLNVSKSVPLWFPVDINFTDKSEDHLWIKIVIL